MTVITGVERRRRWSREDRARILAAIAEPGAVVAEIARREDVCTSLVYKWRRAARCDGNAIACGFSPVVIDSGHRARAANALWIADDAKFCVRGRRGRVQGCAG